MSLVCNYADVVKPSSRRTRSSRAQATARTSMIGSPEDGSTQAEVRAQNHDDLQAAPVSQESPSELHGSVNTAHPCEARPSHTLDSLMGAGRDLRYFGPSSAIALFRTHPPFEEQTTSGRRSNEQPSSEGTGPWSLWTHHKLQGVFEKTVHCSLPSWPEALSLVTAFFEEKYMALPLFHPPAFIARLGQQYSGDFDGGPAWWTSFNAVLAISQRRRVEHGASDDKELAWGYAANALDTVLDILMRATQVMSVQALLILAWFFLGTPNPQPSFMLVANAIRLAHTIGLHRKECSSSLSPVEKATRTNVFWLAFSLDRELSLRTGRPPAQDFGGFEVDLPDSSLQHEFSIHVSSNGLINIFIAASRLAVIQAKLHSRIYLREGIDPSTISDATQALGEDLEEWRVEFSAVLDLESHPELINYSSVLRLNYTYQHCVILVHRAQSEHDWKSLASSERPSTISSSITTAIQNSVDAARAILQLDSLIPDTWKSLTWDVIPISVTAILILSLYTLRRPGTLNVVDDLDSVSTALKRLAGLELSEPGSYLTPVRTVCQDVYRAVLGASNPSNNTPSHSQNTAIGRGQSASQITQVHQENTSGTMRDFSRVTSSDLPPLVETYPEAILNPSNAIDGSSSLPWDQNTLDSWGVPWGFEHLLGDDALTFI
ncbi:fungal specific transcription factor [Colletotrichum salicis]|uniref:Fungal specific transcription factor n=1 Tax=Colletotrichum salicis TaxID=1209931 RepID=A0A135V7L4_9PEZI|nr:fungal specific transcription factor [Colletotrichum salicis]